MIEVTLPHLFSITLLLTVQCLTDVQNSLISVILLSIENLHLYIKHTEELNPNAFQLLSGNNPPKGCASF